MTEAGKAVVALTLSELNVIKVALMQASKVSTNYEIQGRYREVADKFIKLCTERGAVESQGDHHE